MQVYEQCSADLTPCPDCLPMSQILIDVMHSANDLKSLVGWGLGITRTGLYDYRIDVRCDSSNLECHVTWNQGLVNITAWSC